MLDIPFTYELFVSAWRGNEQYDDGTQEFADIMQQFADEYPEYYARMMSEEVG